MSPAVRDRAPRRLSLKLYLADGAAVDPPKLVPLFHEWIRNGTVEGLLIDVADYAHVHQGPATMLIGHEADYALELSEGRPGLVYTRKRPASGDLGADIRQGLRRLLVAAAALARKADPHPPVRFRTDEIRLQALDRLDFPNRPEALTAFSTETRSALQGVFNGIDLKVQSDAADPRQPATLRIKAPGAPDIDTLLARL
jgi:hypothetical protein